MTERLRCCVPFCRRTFAARGSTETMCGRHWRLARRSRRLVYGRLCRELRRDPRPFWEMAPGSPARLRRLKLMRVADRLWDVLKAEAIAVAMGISGSPPDGRGTR